MDRKKLHKDNTGMTLLEVIVAVSIFSITAIVLLQSFVTSSRINKKSDTYLEATTTAQNVMEEIKAKRFKEIALAFNYPVDRLGNSRFSFLQSQVGNIGNSLQIKEVTRQNGTDGGVTYSESVSTMLQIMKMILKLPHLLSHMMVARAINSMQIRRVNILHYDKCGNTT